MSLSILNNISALTAENSMSTTQANLSKTLIQLSTGMKINSGADDAAGLSIANGMNANVAALTQSGQNATNTTGLLQTADGALSQVTSLLNRAVTLATEASSNGLSTSQTAALNTEFTSILNSIDNIGKNTNFNGKDVFTSNAITPFLSDGTSGNNLLGSTSMAVNTLTTTGLGIEGSAQAAGTLTLTANISAGDTVKIGTTTYTFIANNASMTAPTTSGGQTAATVQLGAGSTGAAGTLANLVSAVNGTDGVNSANSEASAGAVVGGTTTAGAVTFTSLNGGLGGNSIATVFTKSGSTAAGTFGGATMANGTAGVDLNTPTDSQAALVAMTTAINTISQSRGSLGADINQLTAASNVMTSQVQNLQSADNGLMNADIGKTVANMTQYNVLQSTGMSALQQANQAQQAVLKLLQ